MLVVCPLIEKILDISDIMLDAVLAICQSHLDSSKDRVEFESTLNSASDVESSSDSSDDWKVNFHVFLPSELEHRLKKCDVRIIGDFNDWKADEALLMSKKEKLSDGWLLAGLVTFRFGTGKIQYKYILKDKTTNELVWELLPNRREGNREINLSNHLNFRRDFDVWDGIILPHDNNHNLFEKYYEKTIKIMLNELINNQKTTKTLESVKHSLNALTEDLNRVYGFDNADHFNNSLCKCLLDILNEKNDKKLGFLWIAAVLANRNEKGEHQWTLNLDNSKSVLKMLSL